MKDMTRAQNMRPWRRATALTGVVLISITACGSGSDETSKPIQSPSVAVTPKAAVTPGAVLTARSGQLAGTRKATGKYFSMYVPTNFTQTSKPLPKGERIAFFVAPSNTPATPVRVAVGADPNPHGTAIQQGRYAEASKRKKGPET